MAKKKTDHVIIRNSNLFCTHCGREQVVAYPVEIPVFTAMITAFNKIHASCPKTWIPPIADNGWTVSQKAAFWLKHGERGLSSEFMYQTLSGNQIGAHMAFPYDPADFKRCHGLLEMVPEWREKLSLMTTTSPVWDKLVANWAELTAMLLEQMATKKDNGMYQMMKGLGC